MSALTELPNREAAIALHARLVQASPGRKVTPASIAAFAESLEEDPTALRAAWELIGVWALRQLDRMLLTEGRVRVRHRSNGSGDGNGKPPAGGGQVVDPEKSLSWYQRLPLWKRPVAIGNTGRRKALGELTHGDCQTIAGFYLRSSTTMREKGDRWSAISRMLTGTERLAGAQGKLAPLTLRFLQEETGGEAGLD